MGAEFSLRRFLTDLGNVATVLDAPFSEPANRRALQVYADRFIDGPVLLRTTDRPGDPLNYRFYARKRKDTVGVAVGAGLLTANASLVPLIQSWSALHGGRPEQSCDFDAGRGLAKTCVYLGGTIPLDDVLGVRGVPRTVRRHAPLFADLALTSCRHVSVDYLNNAVTLYFRAPGPLTDEQCVRFTQIVDATPPERKLAQEMQRYLRVRAYTFSVTISVETGKLERVGFYAVKLPAGNFPKINGRLSLFFSLAPSYDAEESNAVRWSFGGGGKTYVEAERSCFSGVSAAQPMPRVIHAAG
jgi:4-hydroxyphenylpyruvate 3-dimethylallyltransferase